jgi:hypothetical protein
MGVINRTPIVRNGLIMYLDAGNRNSYTSGSAIWRDVSLNNNNGTLVNGPSFNSTNGGSIVFDGSDDRINLPDIGVTELSAFSISCWVRTATGGTYPTVYSEGTPGSWSNNLFSLYYGDYGPGGASGGVRVFFGNGDVISYTTSVIDNVWRNVVYSQINNSNRSLYLNGVQIGANTATITHTVTNAYIGAGNNAGSFLQFFKGDISNLQLYNRALSIPEIIQNYNAQKTRFNLT